MKISYIYNKVALFALAALAFTACNDIDEDDRYIYVEPPQTDKVVLIEDFTGQNCMNCPTATEFIEQMQETYGADRIIAVGIHSGQLAKGMPLYTETGQHYFDQWGIIGQPAGVIDRRTKVEGVNSITPWNTAVNNALSENAPLRLSAATAYDAATRAVTIDVTAEGVLDVSGYLQIWLIEDNILNPQKMPDGSTIRAYEHNHVFRTAVNGEDGEAFTLAWDETKTVSHTYTLDDKWKEADMSVVAFVYNDEGVQQAVKVPVIPASADDDASASED